VRIHSFYCDLGELPESLTDH